MAIVIIGKSTCKICGLVIKASDAYTGFPILVISERDYISSFNDAVVHNTCLAKDEHRIALQEAMSRIDKARKNRVCWVCGEELTTPNDYRFGIFSTDKLSPLFVYNLCQFHSDHFRDWEQLSQLLEHLKYACESGAESLGLCRIYASILDKLK